MKAIWGLLNIVCVVWLFFNLSQGLGIILPLVLAFVFGGLFGSAHTKDQDRKRQIEINDRLTRLEEHRTIPPAPTVTSTVPEGYERVMISGHLVDVPIESRTADRPTRLTNPHEHGANK